jgi:hypothetical protein
MSQADNHPGFNDSRGPPAHADSARRSRRQRQPRLGLAAICALILVPLLAWGATTAHAERVGSAIRALLGVSDRAGAAALSNVLSVRYPPSSYAGRNGNGVPHYTKRPFSRSERELLLEEFGVGHPENLYLSDSTPYAVLLYDPERDCGNACLVGSYRVGAASVRRPGEPWEVMAERVERMPLRRFPRSARIPIHSLAALSPDARGGSSFVAGWKVSSEGASGSSGARAPRGTGRISSYPTAESGFNQWKNCSTRRPCSPRAPPTLLADTGTSRGRHRVRAPCGSAAAPWPSNGIVT